MSAEEFDALQTVASVPQTASQPRSNTLHVLSRTRAKSGLLRDLREHGWTDTIAVVECEGDGR
jgi:hypothetical protein